MTIAHAHYKEDLKTEEENHGRNHPHVAIIRNNLGRVQKAQGNTKGAILNFQTALEIDEEVYGPNHPSVALRSFILADMFHDLGGLRDAKSLYKRALEIVEKNHGANHPDVAVLSSKLVPFHEKFLAFSIWLRTLLSAFLFLQII
ncbi:MAG: tetratricopeptide repeat protein [Methanothrix sp.]|nr:tetratricopeptide repeat protein [Methanothrix sp.]